MGGIRSLALGMLLCIGLVACGGGGGGPAVVATIAVVSGSGQSAPAGSKPGQAIVLVLQDSSGGAVGNATATASVASGGGVLGTSSYTSDSSGKISISDWTLGKTAGDQSLAVTSGTASVTVTARAVAGAPAKMVALADNVASANIGATVAAPGVTVTDANNNPVAGANVSFALAANHGSLAGATAVTNAAGVARVPGWTLGPLVGTQKLVASLGSLSLDIPVNALLAAGCVKQPAAVGLAVNGSWSADDCLDSALDKRYDEYTLKLANPTGFKAILSGPDGRQLRVFTAAGRVVGEMPSDPFAPANVNPLTLQYTLPAGDYLLRVYAPDSATTGAYTLNLSSDFSNAITDPTYCSPVIFATYGSIVTQALTKATSCSFMGDIEDRYILLMETGESVEINLESAKIAPYLILRDDRTPTSPAVATKRLTAPGKATVNYTATFSGFHEIIVTSNTFVEEGAYTVTIVKR